MTTDRAFCRFAYPPSGTSLSITEMPKGGMCLSAFVILHDPSDAHRILLGHLDPHAPWDHIGALDARRAEIHSKGWMIPSSHLIFGEAPEAAARRILVEQLGLRRDRTLEPPQIFSEVATPRRFPDLAHHWDIGFVYTGPLSEPELGPTPAWKDLALVDTRTLKREEMARSHDDVLEAVGLIRPSA